MCKTDVWNYYVLQQPWADKLEDLKKEIPKFLSPISYLSREDCENVQEFFYGYYTIYQNLAKSRPATPVLTLFLMRCFYPYS